jgi:thiamine-phosphate pyrophosphorylase
MMPLSDSRLVMDRIPELYPILDASFLPPLGPLRAPFLMNVVHELLANGITLLQYRNKVDAQQQVLSDARILRRAAPLGQCTLILNDYAELVAEADFDGVHVGQQDLSPEEARRCIGPQRLLGLSTHNPEQLAAASQSSADYLAIGPVFATASKVNPDPVIGLEGVRHARAFTSKPLVAIGGITLENASAVRSAGADSVAVISAIFRGAATPGKIASDFFAKLR